MFKIANFYKHFFITETTRLQIFILHHGRLYNADIAPSTSKPLRNILNVSKLETRSLLSMFFGSEKFADKFSRRKQTKALKTQKFFLVRNKKICQRLNVF